MFVFAVVLFSLGELLGLFGFVLYFFLLFIDSLWFSYHVYRFHPSPHPFATVGEEQNRFSLGLHIEIMGDDTVQTYPLGLRW